VSFIFFFAQTFLLRECIHINVSHSGLDGTGIECQLAGLGSPIQNGPGAYPASYSVGTGFYLGVNWSGHGTEHPSTSSHKVTETVLLYRYSGLSWVNFTFFYSCLSSQNMGIEIGILVCKRMFEVSLLCLNHQ
jgi:hypothetical protein